LEHTGEGYARVVDGPKWTVAELNYAEKFDPAKISYLERHTETDETFVLLAGEATLLIGENAQRFPLEMLKCYNMKKGVWHNIIVSPGTRVLVVENSDTSRSNTEYFEFANAGKAG
jgi:ureidoglycolate hydrolase